MNVVVETLMFECIDENGMGQRDIRVQDSRIIE